MTTLRNSETSKVFAVLAIVGMVALGFSFAVPQAQALTQAEVDTICALVDCDSSTEAALNALVSGSASTGTSFTFTRDLTMGSTGQDVMELQKFLNANGYTVAASGAGSAGNETSYFGSLTAAALADYQAAEGISPAVGYFGPITRSSVNSMTDDSGDTGSGSGTGSSSDLQGGAGDIDSVEFISSYNNEEVGEDQEDVEVAGYEIEATEGSDIELRAITLDFDNEMNEGGDDDFDDYAEEVSVWFNGEEIAREDARSFDDDNDYRRSITLDSGAVIEAGEEGDLVVAVSGIRNLDSGNEKEIWNVGLISVRFMDAQGAIITYSSGSDMESNPDNDTTTDSDERAFSFESFSSAADIELKISKGDDNINDARTIEADDTNDTNGVELFSFELEAEGNSDIEVKDLPVQFATTTSALNEIINSAELFIDGESVGSENISASVSDSGTLVFEDIDYVINAGDTVEAVLEVDLNGTDDFTPGSTLSAEVTDDAADMDVEDEQGNDLSEADGEISGSASSEAHAFYAEGINIAYEDDTAVASGDDNSNYRGTYTIEFEVTAFGEDVYVGTDTATSTDGAAADNLGVVYDVIGDTFTGNDTPNLTSTADEETNSFLVEEGDSETFTLTVVLNNSAPGTEGFYGIEITEIGTNDTDDDPDTGITTGLDDLETDEINLEI